MSYGCQTIPLPNEPIRSVTSSLNSDTIPGAAGVAHAFLWRASTGTRDLGTLGGSLSGAYAINNGGQVVGWSTMPDNVTLHAFVWSAVDGMRDLGTLGGTGATEARSINDAGQVVGGSGVPGNPESHAFLWTASAGMRDLGTLGGSYSIATSQLGRVVGYSVNAPLGSALLWTPTDGIEDLHACALSSWRLGGDVAGE